jgi:hypothetical protein
MHRTSTRDTRIVKATHGLRKVDPDPQFELDMAAYLKQLKCEPLLAPSRHGHGTNPIDVIVRRACLRPLVKWLGTGADIRKDVSVIHPETFEVRDGVFFGEQTIIRGRFGGRHVIGNRVWIGLQRNSRCSRPRDRGLAGWKPGVKFLGSKHVGSANSGPVIRSGSVPEPISASTPLFYSER